MTRIPRLLPCLALACSLTAPVLWAKDAKPKPKPAADAPMATPAADAPAAPAAPDAAAPATPPAPAADAPAPAAAPAADAPAPATAPTTRPKPVIGGDATAAPAPEPAAPPMELSEKEKNQPLRDDVDDFWHYGKIANYRAAVAFGNKIMERPEKEVEKLGAFERTAAEHNDNLDDWILRWEAIDTADMKTVTAKIQGLLTAGRTARRGDKDYILGNIRQLGVNERAYRIHLERLRESGEVVVPYMIDILRSKQADDVALRDPIRRAMVDLGRAILNPLLAATETKDDELKLTLINVLSRIGYDVSVPYLAHITQDRTHPGLAQGASAALVRMGVASPGNVSDQFYHLAEKFYYNNTSIQADMKAASALMWYWTEQGLVSKEVPPQIFADLMAEREAEYALQAGPGKSDALSLWLAANNKVEVDLPEGKTNDAFEKDRPSADYYNAYAGAQYLNAALTRSLEDRNAQVAIRLIKSLAEIVGPSSQGSGVKIDPLAQAMRYPDRLVRFEAAFALAAGLPNSTFPSHERVAPLLAEAVSQTGSANILIIAPSQGDEQKLTADLKQYGIASGTDAHQGLNNALKLPAVDVIVMPESLGNQQIDQVYQLAAGNPRLERASKVIITQSRLSPWAQRALADPLTVVTQASDAAGLSAAIEDARKRAGGLPLDEKVATAYAVKAAQTLQRLAEGRVTAFDLTVTQPTLLASLNDKRPEVVKADGEALAYMNGDQIQVALLTVVVGEKTPDDVRVSLLQSLAKNAKFFGGHLSDANLADLQKLVDSATGNDVRTAAAQARGALNLPAEQAKELIVKQAKR